MALTRRSMIVSGLCAVAGRAAWAQSASADTSDYSPTVGQKGKDVVWVPTPQELVDRMLDMARLTPDDYLVDLGSGDGRTVISAAKRGIRAHGIEFNPDMVQLSRHSAELEGVSGRATFEEGDIFESDFSKATVITLFLLPQLNVKLRPALLDMKPGTRVLSNSFDMDEWKADETFDAEGGCSGYCQAYKWIVPAKVEGNWRLGDGELTLTQRFQMLEGTLRIGENTMPIRDARLTGADIVFSAGDTNYQGHVNGNRIQGTAGSGARWSAIRSMQ